MAWIRSHDNDLINTDRVDVIITESKDTKHRVVVHFASKQHIALNAWTSHANCVTLIDALNKLLSAEAKARFHGH